MLCFFSGIVVGSLVAFKGISCCLAFSMLVGRSILALSGEKSHFFPSSPQCQLTLGLLLCNFS